MIRGYNTDLIMPKKDRHGQIVSGQFEITWFPTTSSGKTMPRWGIDLQRFRVTDIRTRRKVNLQPLNPTYVVFDTGSRRIIGPKRDVHALYQSVGGMLIKGKGRMSQYDAYYMPDDCPPFELEFTFKGAGGTSFKLDAQDSLERRSDGRHQGIVVGQDM